MVHVLSGRIGATQVFVSTKSELDSCTLLTRSGTFPRFVRRIFFVVVLPTLRGPNSILPGNWEIRSGPNFATYSPSEQFASPVSQGSGRPSHANDKSVPATKTFPSLSTDNPAALSLPFPPINEEYVILFPSAVNAMTNASTSPPSSGCAACTARNVGSNVVPVRYGWLKESTKIAEMLALLNLRE